MSLDLDHLRSWIGREETACEMLTPALVRRFEATFDRVSPTLEGDEAPLLIHLCLAQPAAPTAALGEDGHPARGDFLPPVPLPRRMWAGGAFTFHEPIRIGETVERTSRVGDVTLKEGRSGALCFVTVTHRITSGGRLALEERQDLVYRGGQSGAPSRPAAEAAPQGTHRRRVTPSAALLFRYSALTFNGHRIHYDTPYARQTEGYPGLVVHGPLQATLLVAFAAELLGRPPARFTFRSVAPIFDTADFDLNATAEGESLRLWTAAAGGPVAMDARAEG